MKITYLVIALGLLCTFAYAQAKLEDGVMKESDEKTAPVETVEEELVENYDENPEEESNDESPEEESDDENPEEESDDENPEEESEDETDPEHDLEQSDDRELTENNNDVKADPSVENARLCLVVVVVIIDVAVFGVSVLDVVLCSVAVIIDVVVFGVSVLDVVLCSVAVIIDVVVFGVSVLDVVLCSVAVIIDVVVFGVSVLDVVLCSDAVMCTEDVVVSIHDVGSANMAETRMDRSVESVAINKKHSFNFSVLEVGIVV
ncbi:uncharacterized protein LOC124439543 isoform X1 [Xenia sp. Carnegie-2017]|uniref:uncharacterized protein LOC124439543 isoform X1 n=1 Tax=Xenia sp. Carnegie-2017 TaxID=2897299 RepID=UPI001F036B15|nr:uncharacterized protein LOC124439543 isoform X1 [Xenia sp. Carnegie-2017]